METVQSLRERIAVSDHRAKADCIIQNGRIINVFTGEIMEGDIAIKNGYIAGIGSFHEADEIIDAKGAYIAPGFIDAHVHVESAMITPSELARVLLPNGVTTIVTDPHEIANVAGVPGIKFMLKDAEEAPIDMFVMAPSSVPATPQENNGATLLSEDLKPLYQDEKVIGLAEVMDFPSVASGDADILQKIIDAKAHGGRIDGHGAGLTRDNLNNYLAAGIRTDHESTTRDEALDRVQAGMFVMLREGTVGRDLKQAIEAVRIENSHRFCFCTDDKLIPDLIQEGSINYNVKLAISHGIAPITAIQMATINAANCHNLPYLGAVAAGYQADLIFLDRLEDVAITKVFKKGRLLVENGVRREAEFKRAKDDFKSPPITHHFQKSDLRLALKSQNVRVMGMLPNSLFTERLSAHVEIQDGVFIPDSSKDLAKMVVVERHKGTKNIGLGIVKGFGLKNGAIATTVAHDSHNIVAVGTNDTDIERAILRLTEIGGGIVVVSDEQILGELRLEIAGLLTAAPYEKVQKDLEKLLAVFQTISDASGFDPFLTLSFLTLPVIPEYKLTDQGLFDFQKFDFVPLELEEEG
ncbi:adenine deaminase [Listeria fleischmannii]|uniref:Adenine deaminase n=1 Tax=Listeria fleischmannii TaxID=1069827 RepID=A0A841YGU1_9LIST|nr:adenine deaminase [Listeria fleischmannii]MBC1399443.1 adenine deaminase [Listeria fleischmannii]MBC1427829.1 adenine deaminase [Listeria fleischmannii]STY46644.1 Adenine deaminase [Listeria fleischmannii subsp. coloradonensis]